MIPRLIGQYRSVSGRQANSGSSPHAYRAVNCTVRSMSNTPDCVSIHSPFTSTEVANGNEIYMRDELLSRQGASIRRIGFAKAQLMITECFPAGASGCGRP